MTISLLLVVMRILTVATCSKLEMLPVSGAPSAQHTWGRHRLALPASTPARSWEPAQGTQALLGWKRLLTALCSPGGSRGSGRAGRWSLPLPGSSRSPARSPTQLPAGGWGGHGCGGRRGEGCAGSARTAEQAAQRNAQGAGVICQL